MLTTLGATAAATAVQSGAAALPCTTVGELFAFELVVAVEAVGVAVFWSPSCVTAYVPPLASTAASRATPTVWPKRFSRRGAGRLPGPNGGVGPVCGATGADWV